jgi:DHA2 family multidrug resistance protein-like MFS transporter
MTMSGNIEKAASAGIITNVLFAVLALIAIMFLVPKTKQGVAKQSVSQGNEKFTNPVKEIN